VPKIALVSAPRAGGAISTRSFIPIECHASIGVFAAVTVATACVLPGSPAARVANVPAGREKFMSVEHPTGEFTVELETRSTSTGTEVTRSALLRTARALFTGTVLVPEALWNPAGAHAAVPNPVDTRATLAEPRR
jgi:4-oxalomesaconate tautomerase